MGYVAGGLVAGIAADVSSFEGAIGVVAVLTGLSGLWVAVDLPARGSRNRRSVALVPRQISILTE